MKKTIFILLCIPSFLFAQDWGRFSQKQSKDGQLYGKIVDIQTNEPLAFANVILLNNDKTVLEGSITDEKGKFEFKELELKQYFLHIQFIGFNDTILKIELTKKNPILNLKAIDLNVATTILNEVLIEEEKPIYEAKLEKIIYNAENDLNESLNDATDVLRKTPLLSVDLDGNVSLRGSQNIKFLLNGRSSSFFTSDATEALKMISADQIKSIEVITSPTAKYDGEGDAGVINIITKEKNIQGFKNTLSGTTGTRANHSRMSFDYGKGKLGVSAKGSARYGWPRDSKSSFLREDYIDSTTIVKLGTGKSNWVGFGGGIELYYAINGFNHIVGGFDFWGSKKFKDEESNDSIFSGIQTDILDSLYKTNIYENHFDHSYEFSVGYEKKWENNEKRELKVNYQLGNEIHDDVNNLEYGFNETNGIYDSFLENKNDGIALEHTAQIDYSNPIGKKHSLDFGIKHITRDIDTDYKTIGNNDTIQIPENFQYLQKVNAAYLSSNFYLKNNYSLVAGVRLESTHLSGEKLNDELDSLYEKKNYLHILPSFVLSKDMKMGTSLKLSYTKRIKRPGMHHINPNSVINNNYSIEIGNPNLKPSLTNQIELGYNNYAKKIKGSYYIYYKNQKDLIESFVTIQNDTTFTEYRNIGSNNSIGVNYFGTTSLGKLDIRFGFNIFTYQTKKDNLGTILYNWNVGGNYDFGKGYFVEFFSFYRSPTRTIQGFTPNFNMMSIGLKKEFKNDKGSLGVRMFEPFRKYKSFESEINEEGVFHQESNFEILFRSVGLSFKYTLGEVNFNPIKKKSKIKNDDKIEESDSDY